MKLARFTVPSLLVALVLVVVVAVSCSKSNPYTPPGGGGGGGGGGPELNSGTLANGQGFQHTFAASGSFPYHCAIHGLSMAGTVTVGSGGADSVLVGFGPGLVYNPASVTVKPGGYVRWLNNSGIAHTVTSN